MKTCRIPTALRPIGLVALLAAAAMAQTATPVASSPAAAAASTPPKFPALGIPAPGPAATTGAYAPQPLLPGGIVVPLYPPDSPRLKRERIGEPEKYNMSTSTPGRINSVINIHYPSIEVHPAGGSTGTAVILIAGGGHRTLNVGGESADPTAWLFNYGVTTIILRHRLKYEGYDLEKDAMTDGLQAIRLVRAHAKEWRIDPNRIGMLGFSAGAELAAWAAVLYEDFDRDNRDPADPLAGVSSRPDFVGLVYPGPSPFKKYPETKVPATTPPSFLICPGSGDRDHAIWADQYFAALLTHSVPNLEMHIYGNGSHGGAMSDRNGIPYGKWPDRYIEWFRDLGFLTKSGTETKAASDVAAYARQRAAAAAKK